MIHEYHITVSRTARYYTLGELNNKTKSIWFLLHGHKQLAKDFILNFRELADDGNYLIAPEGLMRGYIKGDYGDVGASWMTKEDRESDIKDYVNYLDELFEKEIAPHLNQNIKVNALGFSQGAATLSRWLALDKPKIDKAVFWCGSVASDVDFSKQSAEGGLKNTEIHLVFGSNDRYYDSNFSNEQVKIITDAGLHPQSYTFNGGHEVNTKLMQEANLI